MKLTLPNEKSTKHIALYKAVNSLIERISVLEGAAKITEWTKHEIPARTLEWGAEAPEKMTWEEAQKWCEAQGGRLPTALDLQQAYADKVEGFTQSNYYWSGTTNPFNYSNALIVYFGYGSSGSDTKTNSLYVRCVRG